MEWIVEKTQSFWVWLQGLSFFGQILLMLLSVVVLLFVFWRAKNTIIKKFRRWVIRYQSFKYRTLWEPVALSIVVIGIFICLFGKKLLIDMDQDTLRNLILVTAGVVGWYFLYQRTKTADQNKKAAEQSAEATRKNAKTSEQGLTVERFTRAIEQLAHEESYVRVGGIRGLEKIAYIGEEDNVKIAQILATFIQTQAAKNSERTQKDIATYKCSKPEVGDDFSIYRAQRLDIEAAVHALANIALKTLEGYFEEENSKPKRELCDLRNTDFCGLQLNKIDLSGFNLTGVNFSGALLIGANFTRASIGIPVLKKEDMTKFIGAVLNDAIFNDSNAPYVDFSASMLTGARFNNAYLGKSIFDECCINRTNFETSKNLTQKQIDKAYRLVEDSSPLLPKGFNPPPSRL